MRKFTLFAALFAAMTLFAQTPEWTAQIEIEGQQITSLNCQNLHELLKAVPKDDQKEMAVTYDREKSVLLFRNADIKWADAKNAPFLKVEEKLTIVAEGENSVEMVDSKNFIAAKNDVTIQGGEAAENKLLTYGISWGQKVEKASFSGTFALLDGNVNLTISNLILSANYYEHAFVGGQDATNKVNLNNVSCMIDISKEATKNIAEMNLSGCAITKPAGAAFSSQLKGIALDGQLVAGTQIAIRLAGQAIDQITNDQAPMTNKTIKDGRLIILRGDKTYTVSGQEMIVP